MNRYIEPEVSGGLGHGTIMDTSSHPPKVSKLEFEFYGWLGDDIIESFPCYIVTENLKNKIANEQLSGILFDDVTITKSQEFIELFPNTELPNFSWANIIGIKKTISILTRIID